MADPGFPVGGGAPTHWGGANLRRVHFLVKMYAKMKEMDPVGGGGGAPAAPPGSANGFIQWLSELNKTEMSLKMFTYFISQLNSTVLRRLEQFDKVRMYNEERMTNDDNLESNLLTSSLL